MESSTAIAKVIESCLDDERIIVQGSKLLDSQGSAVLTRLADERRRFSAELERLTGPIGRGHLGSWTALVRELGDDLLPRAAGHKARNAIAACRRSQHRIDVRYEKALELEWPSAVKAALVVQHERVREAAAELAEMIPSADDS